MRLPRNFQALVLRWLPLAFVATVLSALVYAGVQQNFRQSANDPQLQIVQDASDYLSAGNDPHLLASGQQINLSTSLYPFLVAYSSARQPVVSSGQLNNQTPELPSGIFDNVDKKGEQRFTWEPQNGVRIAAVVRKYQAPNNQSGYILVGRSLREIEKREDQLTVMTIAAWLIALAGSLLIMVLIDYRAQGGRWWGTLKSRFAKLKPRARTKTAKQR